MTFKFSQKISLTLIFLDQNPYGPSNTTIAKDGIDQGDSLSPLLWRIFYDPLIAAITESNLHGYSLSCKWPTNVTDPHTWENHEIKVSTSVFMDDTAWIDSSQERIQTILNIAANFFDIMDIKVNLKKCKLIVINPSVPIPLQKVTLDAAKSHWITPVHSDARYLGVWISAKRSKQHTKKRIEEL